MDVNSYYYYYNNNNNYYYYYYFSFVLEGGTGGDVPRFDIFRTSNMACFNTSLISLEFLRLLHSCSGLVLASSIFGQVTRIMRKQLPRSVVIFPSSEISYKSFKKSL